MAPELVAEGVRLGLIAVADTTKYLDPPPPRRDCVDEAVSGLTMQLAHTGGWCPIQ